MDTAKVDIRKLQLLNDRINQCIDALSQVRLSVHGLSHSGLQQQNVGGFVGQGIGSPYGSPYGAQPGFGSPQAYGLQGFGYPGVGLQGQVPGPVPFGGIAHTSPGQPFQQGIGAPWQQGVGSPFQQAIGFGGQQAGFGQWSPYGLSHTSGESEYYGRVPLSDPFMTMRIAQTFPYAQQAVPPYTPVY
jgi:hypothetical protein